MVFNEPRRKIFANFTGMGTELEYALINPLPLPLPLPTTKNKNSFAASLLNNWDDFGNKGLKKDTKNSFLINIVSSMDRMLEQQNIEESIKRTMLMQEDIFKQQVRELHRLYRVQRMMMDELRNETKQSSRSNSYWGLPISQERSGSTCSGNTLKKIQNGLIDLERMHVRENLSTEEGPSNYTFRAMKNIDHIIGKDGFDESCVELSLSIGGSSRGKSSPKSSSSGPKLGFTFKVEECNTASNTTSMAMANSTTTTPDQQNKRPHWLFQGLSLNRM